MYSDYGLVVCGGKSTRMGMDKSLLNYHGKPQRYYVYEMLQSLCERVFISCNKHQAPDIPSVYEVLVDEPEYEDIGPMGALLTAFKHNPNKDFLVVGCDYPLIDFEHLEQLIKVKLQTNNTTAYYNNERKFYDPIICDYQSIITYKLIDNFKLKQYSLQKILKDISASIIIPDDPMVIKSIDTIDEYKKIVKQLYNTENDNSF